MLYCWGVTALVLSAAQVRPPWARQIADGDYAVAVGRRKRTRVEGGHHCCVPAAPSGAPAPEAPAERKEVDDAETIMVSCPQPYFVEDGLYCPESELVDPKPLRLLVSPLPRCAGAPPDAAGAVAGYPGATVAAPEIGGGMTSCPS